VAYRLAVTVPAAGTRELFVGSVDALFEALRNLGEYDEKNMIRHALHSAGVWTDEIRVHGRFAKVTIQRTT
jgi:hypothetical protein